MLTKQSAVAMVSRSNQRSPLSVLCPWLASGEWPEVFHCGFYSVNFSFQRVFHSMNVSSLIGSQIC